VQGCDVWLNNPEYPLEASGTSGEKAGINGVVNVSVLDGWWDEGYLAGGADAPNGFAVQPVDPRYWAGLVDDAEARRRRDVEVGRQLLDILEHQVVPLYNGDRNQKYSGDWVQISKNSMKTLIPRFNSSRQVMDYVRQFYGPAARQTHRFSGAEGLSLARALAAWKMKVRARWSGVSLKVDGSPAQALQQGESLQLAVLATLNGLSPSDIRVECVLTSPDSGGENVTRKIIPFVAESASSGETTRFVLKLDPLPGLQNFRVRALPVHEALSHPFEMGCLVWA